LLATPKYRRNEKSFLGTFMPDRRYEEDFISNQHFQAENDDPAVQFCHTAGPNFM
jgi:hypothetical protein